LPSIGPKRETKSNAGNVVTGRGGGRRFFKRAPVVGEERGERGG